MALETRTTGANTTYLNIDFGKKQLYINSLEEKDGFEKHTNSKGKVTYRQYVSAVSGKIVGTYFRDSPVGKQLQMVFEDEGSKYSIGVGIDSVVFLAIGRTLKNVDIKNKVRLAIYPNPAKQGDKVYWGVSFSYPDIPGDNGKPLLVEWGDELPAWKQKRNGDWDSSDAEDEAYGRVEDFIAKNGFDQQQQQTSQSEPVPSQKNDSKPAEEDFDSSELPF